MRAARVSDSREMASNFLGDSIFSPTNTRLWCTSPNFLQFLSLSVSLSLSVFSGGVDMPRTRRGGRREDLRNGNVRAPNLCVALSLCLLTATIHDTASHGTGSSSIVGDDTLSHVNASARAREFGGYSVEYWQALSLVRRRRASSRAVHNLKIQLAFKTAMANDDWSDF
jgi:hypothetical protein